MRFQLATLLLLGLLFCGCGTDVPTHYDVGVAKFKIPEGWIASEGENDSVVVLTRDEETESISAIISVDILTAPPNSTFVEAASAYAGRHNGTIQPDGVLVAGEKAIPSLRQIALWSCAKAKLYSSMEAQSALQRSSQYSTRS